MRRWLALTFLAPALLAGCSRTAKVLPNPSPQELANMQAETAHGTATMLTSAENHYKSPGDGMGVAYLFVKGGKERFAMAAALSGSGEGELFANTGAPIYIGYIGLVKFVEGYVPDDRVRQVKVSFEPSGKEIVIPVHGPQTFVIPVPEELRFAEIHFGAFDATGQVLVGGLPPYPNQSSNWNGS